VSAARRRCGAGHPITGSRPCHVCRVAAIAAVASSACPDLAAGDVTAAVTATVTSAAVARSLMAALTHGPAVLAAGAPPVVARLVGELRARGASLAEPVCAHCERAGRELIRVGTIGLCPRCRTHQLAEACSACRRLRVVTARTAAGGSLCFACAPRPARVCGRCGREGPIARRARDGEPDICNRCYRLPMAACGICGQLRRCSFVAEGHPLCSACGPRRSLTCAHCGEYRQPSAHWPEGPVCEPCYRSGLRRRGTCVDCGTDRRLVDPPGPGAVRCADCAGRRGLQRRCQTCGTEDLTYADGCCARCVLSSRARRRCSDRSGRVVPELAAVAAAIANTRQPYSALNWLERSAAGALLTEIASSELPITHEALDAAGPGAAAAEFLRQMFVTAGVLASRDEALVRLEIWVAERLDGITEPGRAALLRSYATWRVLYRARRRAARSARPRTATRYAKTKLLTAIAFCDWLARRDLPLADCTQTDVEIWLAESGPAAPEINDFLEWAAQRHLARPLTVRHPRSQHGTALADKTHWAIVERLLHDDQVDLTDRVAGCLVLLYAQQLTRILALTINHVTTSHDGIHLQFGPAPVIIPEPLGGLLVQLAATGRHHVGVGSPAQATWLFPGLHPGRPLTPQHLGQRLIKLGIHTMPARRGALMHLASQLPAAVLAEMLHLHPTTAVHWVAAAGGDWNTYAAQIARHR
jgi:hypothetical protein